MRQQAITWANIDPDLYHHMASLGRNKLKVPRAKTLKRDASNAILSAG